MGESAGEVAQFISIGDIIPKKRKGYAMPPDEILRLNEAERLGIENKTKIEAAKEDLGQAYRRIEKIENKLDRLNTKVVQMGAISAIAIPLVTAFLINLLGK